MKKKQVVGIVSGVVIAFAFVLTIVSVSLTAPGFQVNGTDIGFNTPKSAAQKLDNSLTNTSININDQKFTYDELGVSYDQKVLNELLENHKTYSLDSWNSKKTQAITIDEDKMREAVSKKLPDIYTDPVNASVKLDENGENWTVVKGKNGTSPIVEELRKSVEKDLTANSTTDETKSYTLKEEEIEPAITTKTAQDFADKVNNLASTAGYYEGDTEKLKISKSDFNELIQVDVTDEGDGFKIIALEDSLRNYAETLPDKLNTKVDNGEAIVDENGKTLKTVDPWTDGYTFSDVDGLVSRSVEQLNKGESSKIQLEGKTEKAKVDKKFRRIEVDLDARRATTYENDKVVKTYKIAVGKAATPTDKGNFKVFYQTKKQDMGCTSRYDYCTKDVPFASFYNGGEAFHGVWWHNDFGNPNASAKSHGCVNMRISDAEEIYYFAQIGTPVHVF